MADNARAKRLADLIREVVAQKLQRGIKDPRLGSHVTITDTRVTGDLREATVFYTVYGDEEERKAAAAGLESAKGVLRSAVGAAAGVKFTPTLTFVADALPDTARTIEDLLDRVRKRSAKVGYATVYRTMKLLTEAGLAVPRQFGDGQTRFEVADEIQHHHDHLICAKCGLILEFENEKIEQLQDQIAEELGGFQVVRHKLELYCLCPKAMGIKGGHCPNEDLARR